MESAFSLILLVAFFVGGYFISRRAPRVGTALISIGIFFLATTIFALLTTMLGGSSIAVYIGLVFGAASVFGFWTWQGYRRKTGGKGVSATAGEWQSSSSDSDDDWQSS